MRTVSPKHPKGQEPRRRWTDDVRLLWYILRVGVHYAVTGYFIRRRWYAKQRARQKFYVDDERAT